MPRPTDKAAYTQVKDQRTSELARSVKPSAYPSAPGSQAANRAA